MSASTLPAPARPGKDPVLSVAVDLAREAALTEAEWGQVGEHLGFVLEDTRLGTHYFECTAPGYRGWHWAVTMARVPRGRTPTVCECELLPGPDSLLAAPWVPWADRLAPDDVSSTDRLPYNPDDARLEPGYVATGDEEMDRVAIRELGLGRDRVLTREAEDEAATRWYEGSHGPHTAGTKAAGAQCETCGFIVPLAGHLGTLFGVCVNEWSPDDGKVVSLDHGCGSHSETDVASGRHEWDQGELVINEADIDVIR